MVRFPVVHPLGSDDPVLVADAHEYCDRCCWRCSLSVRCEYYLGFAASAEAGADHTGSRAAGAVFTAVKQRRAFVERAMPLPFEGGSALAIEGGDDPICSRALADPLVLRATNYAVAASGIVRALRPMLATFLEGDPRAHAAIDRIEEVCLIVGSKTFRAVLGSYWPEFDPSEVQTDANGSAKVARLLIEESRRAWMILLEPGREVADGVPSRFVIVLNELEATLAERFPRALEFIRPGFDTEARETVAGAVNHAVCRSGVPCGHA